jgi:hypothetical protein
MGARLGRGVSHVSQRTLDGKGKHRESAFTTTSTAAQSKRLGSPFTMKFECMDFVLLRGSSGQTELLGVEGTAWIGRELSNCLDIGSASRPIRFAKAQQLGTAHPRQVINIGPDYR